MQYFLLTISLFLTVSITASAYPDPYVNRQFDSLLAQHPEFNGAILVMKKDSVVASVVKGVANAQGSPLHLSSSFNLASLSKHFTALSIARLLEKDQLQLKTYVSEYLPALKNEKYRNITLEHLLHHTSGLPDFEKLYQTYPTYAEPFATNKSLLRLFETQEPDLDFDPGLKHEYSNTGYIFLASIVEEVTGKTFGGYLKEEFFDPLDMKNAFGYTHAYADKHPERVKGIHLTKDKIVLNDLTPMDGIIGDGNIYMSIHDFIKWERFLNSDKILSEEWKEKYFKPGRNLPKGSVPYGYGWVVYEDRQVMQHAGGWVGFSTMYYRDLKSGYSFVALSNGSMENEQFKSLLMDVLAMIKKNMS
ncbi:serine hydrolase domain-containing protein [Psychroflexus sediminis]|uniref:CubicO group peptidase, beta-lactamase class C family n=1 Tax=Psychroflexus sediminis TaxID=470826 RepID=A0A1G7VCX1_9FLAO|nr:serine hydrolase domain-containing protein [Psychroflexus sediminis]SDG56790.1 CubicO group peptidase, beta-lactamase class C family [Psychroflexus sediminis]